MVGYISACVAVGNLPRGLGALRMAESVPEAPIYLSRQCLSPRLLQNFASPKRTINLGISHSASHIVRGK